jgi:hypothetical protein
MTCLLRYHPGLGPLHYSCASRRISSSAQPACSVRSLIDVCNLLLILLYARIWSYVSRYYFFRVVCSGCVIFFPLKLYSIWGCVLSVWQVVGALWIVAKLGSWLHSLTLVWKGTSHWCFWFALLVIHKIVHRILLKAFSCINLQYIFPYSYYSRQLHMNLHFLPVESDSSTCGIMPEDWIILNFFCILIHWNWFVT